MLSLGNGMLLLTCRFASHAVCHQAHCRWHLGMQGLRQDPGWRSLRAEVGPRVTVKSNGNEIIDRIFAKSSPAFPRSTASAVTVRSTIRRLREATEA